MAEKYCSVHTVMIYDRGGMSRIGEITRLSRVEWSRDRDGVSEALIRIEGTSCSAQRDMFKNISTKRHELVIFRGEDRVWEGPIFRISDEGFRITIAAKDVCAYLFGTALTREWDNSSSNATTMTARMGAIIEYELQHDRVGRSLGGSPVVIPAWESLDPPVNILPHLQIHHFPNEARTAAKTMPFELTVGEHLASAARTSGIDYCAVGRAIHLWDTSRSIGQTRVLTEKDFYGNVITTDYGSDHTQGSYVVGQGGMYGEAIEAEHMDYYGPWMKIFNAYNEEATEAPTQAELNSQAARNVSGRSPVPMEVRVPDNSTIRLSETLTIHDLVPGVRVPLRATLNARTADQDQKLDHVRVVEEANGETISVTLTPASRPDSDEEEG